MQHSPIIIIATHQRYAITMANIKSLHPYTVVLLVTDLNEAELYRSADNVLVVITPNEPLGNKWQTGVDTAKQMPHSHLVITGSDDILARDYVRWASNTGKDFIGLRQWYILHDKKLYHVEYQAKDDMPLGGGRVYSKALLDKMNYQVFDSSKSKLLDDKGWEAAKESQYTLVHEPLLLAVKGDWPVMNKVDLKHKNIKLLNFYTGNDVKQAIKENFDYEYKE